MMKKDKARLKRSKKTKSDKVNKEDIHSDTFDTSEENSSQKADLDDDIVNSNSSEN